MLRVNHLTFSYQKEETIKDINFEVKRGELSCLLGPNGSGKTTILKCLNGIIKPNEGAIYINNIKLEQIDRRNISRHISMVFQEHNVVFSYKVIDVVILGITPYLKFGTMPQKEDYKKAELTLKKLGLSKLKDRNYNELSGGEKQMVLIARALMQDTEFLILDEPSSHLDFKNQYLLMAEIKKLTEEGKGVITALHDPNLALSFCDRVIILKEGEIIAKGKTSDTLNNLNLQKAYDMEVKIDNINNRRVVFPKINNFKANKI